MSFKIVAIGRSQMLYNTIKLLHEKGYVIKGIVTSKSRPEYTKKEMDFMELAKNLQIPCIVANKLDSEEVKELCLDVDIAVSTNWISVIKSEQINWFKLGILNAHLGDLPKYRGNATPNWALLNGEKEILLSIHFMEGEKMDIGRIVVQKKFDIKEDTYVDDIYRWAEKTIPLSFLEALKILEKNPNYTLKYASANDPLSFRCYPRLPEYSYIDWEEDVEKIYRLIRASTYPYEAYTYKVENGKIKKLYIKKARIVCSETKDLAESGHILKNDKNTGESWIKCGRGVLAIKLCRYESEENYFEPGKRWKSIRAYLGLYPDDLIRLIKEKGLLK